MSDLYKKLSKISDEDFIVEDTTPRDFISSGVIIFNLAMSGRIDGAVPVGGISMFSAPTQLGKTIMGLSTIRNAQKKGMFCIVIDAEFAWDWNLAKNMGIDLSREKLLVYQSDMIESVQSKIVEITDDISVDERKKLFFMIDSWGTLVNQETVDKAKDINSKKDMNEVLKKNKLANLIGNTKSTFYITNHVYDNVGGFGDPLKIPGGKKIIYRAHNVILGRSKAKEELTIKKEDILFGTIASCRVYKSRFSQEHKDFKYKIKYDGGLDIFYGILDDAIEGGFVTKTDTGYYYRNHIKDDKRKYERDIYCSDFWIPIFNETNFKNYIESKWKLKGNFDTANDTFYDAISSQNKPTTKEPEVK